MELIASGRTAEVFAWDDGRVLKLDRPEWNGLAAMEAAALAIVTAAGVPAPRPYEMVMVGDRHGLVLERVDGPILTDVIEAATDVEALAVTWTAMQTAVNEHTVDGLPDLVTGLVNSLRTSGLGTALVEELRGVLAELDDGRRVLCHFDLHPGNVIVGRDGWVVIDWMTASSGPPDADFARTLLFDPPGASSKRPQFMAAVKRLGLEARGTTTARLDEWMRVVAGARLAEGFDGEHATFLSAIAGGDLRITG